MLEVLIGLLDLLTWLLWLPKAIADLWRWLTEERALAHMTRARTPEMGNIRFVARLLLGLWLAASLASAIYWIEPWLDSVPRFFLGLAGFIAGPALLVYATGKWRDRVVARLARRDR